MNFIKHQKEQYRNQKLKADAGIENRGKSANTTEH
jgi:hypothetical protein